MTDAVLETIRRFALVAPGHRVLVACSGGPDSLSLLHVLRALAPRLAIRLRAVYVDHGLRKEASREGRFVVAEASKLGLAAEVVRVMLKGRSMEQARTARYQALGQLARARGATHLATGHTASDQAETVLLRLVRGAGVRGLSAMEPIRPLGREALGIQLIRPLLGVGRAEVVAFCTRLGLHPVADPTNRREVYLRNRIRKELLPWLERENPRIERSLCRLAEHLRGLDSLLDRAAARVDPAEVPGLQSAPPAVRARALEHAHLAAMERLIFSPKGSGALALPGGLLLERSYDRLSFRPKVQEIHVLEPGRYAFPPFVVEIRPASGHGGRFCFDAARAPLPWVVRVPQPGDRIRPRGLGGTKKLSDIFIDEKVPRAARKNVPVVTCRGEVLCVGNLRASEIGRPQADSTSFLELAVLTS